MSDRDKRGMRRVMHRVIGAAQAPFGFLLAQEQTRLVQSPLGLAQVLVLRASVIAATLRA